MHDCVCLCRLEELKVMAGRIMEMRKALKEGLEKEGKCCVEQPTAAMIGMLYGWLLAGGS